MSAYDDCAEVGFHRLGCLCKRGAPPAMTDPRVPAPVPAKDAPPLSADERNTGIALAILAATKNVDGLYDAAKSLFAQLAAARDDAARLDWLQSILDDGRRDGDGSAAWRRNAAIGRLTKLFLPHEDSDGLLSLDRIVIRERIDDARAAHQEER